MVSRRVKKCYKKINRHRMKSVWQEMCVICCKIIEERLLIKRFKQRQEGCEGGDKLCGYLTKSFPGKENNKCKGSEAGRSLDVLEEK